ncbi:hypothetical protein C8T65DRAFT_744782 [Cerioporus squamosus]|nr:hypothetical protein C8T65DRAFT_744782 [Cerioporus squamosus]
MAECKKPGPGWLLIDRLDLPLHVSREPHDVDQDAWIWERARRDMHLALGPNPVYKAKAKYAEAVATDFDAKWLRSITTWNKKAERMETEQEALTRTANRHNQARKWVLNNWDDLVKAATPTTAATTATRTLVNLLDSTIRDDTPRAKSARDLFIAAHPEVREHVRAQLKEQGVTSSSALQAAVNAAYSDAIDKVKLDGSFERYNADAAASRAEAAAERERREAEALAEHGGDPVAARRKELEDLYYTVNCYVEELATKTNTKMVVFYAGKNENKKMRKWQVSSTAREPDDIIALLKDMKEFHNIMDQWASKPLVKDGMPSSASDAASSAPELIVSAPLAPSELSAPESSAPSPPARPAVSTSKPRTVAEPQVFQPAASEAVVSEPSAPSQPSPARTSTQSPPTPPAALQPLVSESPAVCDPSVSQPEVSEPPVMVLSPTTQPDAPPVSQSVATEPAIINHPFVPEPEASAAIKLRTPLGLQPVATEAVVINDPPVPEPAASKPAVSASSATDFRPSAVLQAVATEPPVVNDPSIVAAHPPSDSVVLQAESIKPAQSMPKPHILEPIEPAASEPVLPACSNMSAMETPPTALTPVQRSSRLQQAPVTIVPPEAAAKPATRSSKRKERDENVAQVPEAKSKSSKKKRKY